MRHRASCKDQSGTDSIRGSEYREGQMSFADRQSPIQTSVDPEGSSNRLVTCHRPFVALTVTGTRRLTPEERVLPDCRQCRINTAARPSIYSTKPIAAFL